MYWAPIILLSLCCVQLFATTQTATHQAPLSMEFFQARIWSGLPFPTSGESSWPRDQTCISCIPCIGRRFIYHWVTWEALLPTQGMIRIFKIHQSDRWKRASCCNLNFFYEENRSSPCTWQWPEEGESEIRESSEPGLKRGRRNGQVRQANCALNVGVLETAWKLNQAPRRDRITEKESRRNHTYIIVCAGLELGW